VALCRFTIKLAACRELLSIDSRRQHMSFFPQVLEIDRQLDTQ
jgi:hypothetical protein